MTDIEKITDKEKFVKLLYNSKYAVFFGGAGTSTASGIPDFRSSGGIFDSDCFGLSPEEIVSDYFFYKHPEEFYKFYKSRMVFPSAEPNMAHKKLAELEQIGIIKSIITQNIDGLHQKAGSKNVLELHGSVWRNYCLHCKKTFSLDYVTGSKNAPRCDRCGGIVKPDVVLYGEQLDSDTINKACKEIEKSDLLIVGGTSLAVYPAASFVYSFRGKHLVVINKTPTGADENAEILLRDNIADIFDF